MTVEPGRKASKLPAPGYGDRGPPPGGALYVVSQSGTRHLRAGRHSYAAGAHRVATLCGFHVDPAVSAPWDKGPVCRWCQEEAVQRAKSQTPKAGV